jgi:hypothetical protein
MSVGVEDEGEVITEEARIDEIFDTSEMKAIIVPTEATAEIPIVENFNLEIILKIRSILEYRVSEITLPSRVLTSGYSDYLAKIFDIKTLTEISSNFPNKDFNIIYAHLMKTINDYYPPEILTSFGNMYKDLHKAYNDLLRAEP